MKHAPALPIIQDTLTQVSSPPLEQAASFESCELTQVQWSGQEAKRIQFDSVRLSAPDLTGARFRDGSWADVEVHDGQLAALDITGSALRRVIVRASRLDGLVLSETTAKDVVVTDCKLDLANLRFAKWTHVSFARCSLREADLAGAILKNIVFTDCDLTAADFSNAKLTNVDLRGSRLANLRGLTSLSGATISYDQLITLGPELAAALNIQVQ